MQGIDLIAAERKRQIEEEGFDDLHDADHTNSELALAAICYATPKRIHIISTNYGKDDDVFLADPFPTNWDIDWDKRIDFLKPYIDDYKCKK